MIVTKTNHESMVNGKSTTKKVTLNASRQNHYSCYNAPAADFPAANKRRDFIFYVCISKFYLTLTII